MVHINQHRSRRRPFALIASMAIAALTLTSCGSSGGSDAGDAAEEVAINEEAAALLPDTISSAGTLSMVSDFAYPPYATQEDDGTLGGTDYELMNAIAARLGLKPDWTVSKGFSTLIPAVENGRAQVAVESIAITEERLDALNFVAYQLETDYLIVAAGNPNDLDPKNLCGASLATQTGAAEQKYLEDLSDECVEAGREPITQAFFADNKAALQAVTSGQAEGLAEGLGPANADSEGSNGALELVKSTPITKVDGKTPMSEYTVGIGVAKSDEGEALGEAITKALVAMQEDGTYDEMVADYGYTSVPATLVREQGQIPTN